MAEYSTAQHDGRACVVCNHEDGAMQPAGFGPCGQLFAHVSCQDGTRVAAQLDQQGAEEAAYQEHPTEIARRALYEAAKAESGQWPQLLLELAGALPRRRFDAQTRGGQNA